MTSAAKIRRYILSGLLYIVLFCFFSGLGEAYRLSPGKDAVHKLVDVISKPGKITSNPIPSFERFDMLVGLTGAASVYGIVLYKKKTAKKWRKDIEYGSARWGNKADIAPYVDPAPDNNIILTASESLMLNGRPKNPKYARNKNILVVGGSGSGKTRFFVKPNIMQLHSSYICTDPKGTLVLECGSLLKRNNYEIKILNTIDFKKSLHYNPFVYIRSEKDILKFVTALIANTQGDQKGGDPFWTKAETLLYCALIGYIHYCGPEEEQNMNSLVEMINAMEVHEDDGATRIAV